MFQRRKTERKATERARDANGAIQYKHTYIQIIDIHNMYVGRYIPVSSTTGIRFFGNVYTDL